jgi:hypothetical protein
VCCVRGDDHGADLQETREVCEGILACSPCMTRLFLDFWMKMASGFVEGMLMPRDSIVVCVRSLSMTCLREGSISDPSAE